ncbi:discoidin domain-containing protein [Breznakia sp. PFB2-8]|uniref:discoidin domain-containing protein n=2 Tax=unclassified Breznakia TaxID=2623764 RepID=UPI002405AB3D|nr:discoidin domain-containing protein [Breznakia sp. PFB2-8]
MKKIKKFYKYVLVSILCITTMLPGGIKINAQEPSFDDLALNKPVTASNAYSSMPASYLTDGDPESRWSSERDATQWAYVDLGESLNMDYFSMIWESDSVYAENYNIYVSDSTSEWGTPVVAKVGNTTKKSEDILKAPVVGRYVKLEVTKVKGYPSVSCREFKVKYTGDEAPQDPNENVALGKTGVASTIEANSLSAANAFDGDTTSRTSRWASAVKNAPHWLYVDLGAKMNVKTLRLFWENRKATKYSIQVADTLSEPMQESDWTKVKEFNDRPSKINEKIVLDEVVKARYVRLYIDSATKEDPDGGVEWNTVSLYEMEVYGGEPKENISDIKENIEIVQPVKGDKKLVVKYPDTEDYDITYNGTDYEQVVDEDLSIYEPVVDTSVKVSFKIVDKKTEKYEFEEKEVKIPGTYIKEETDNASPVVLPELREWKGGSGEFVPTQASRVVIADAKLQDVAEAFAKDYKEITGNDIEVVNGSASAQDFYFALTSDTSKGLQEEGYIIDISDSVKVEAETTTGAYWATRTILQSIKANDSIPKGITRDYPLYEVRGFILDVGRKTFTLDYLEQVVKEMSWYKMNDFQVHLNDNLIPLENYSAKGLDPMDAYSGFRLESDIKKGGNNGLNQADLTSTDVFYTKDEFRNFIKESRIYGVNIVPEIDTPAHSLALTKVRPDLRHGTYGRDNDHLNLTSKYDESIAFVKDIFDEYMGSDVSNPVFDEDTIIHVGADEYNANHEAYRKFADDMLKYTQDTGRTARIWGSLSVSKGTTPVRSKDVQMNLWNFGYANMNAMYEEGYDLINCNDGNYYIVPNAGYYYDYLNNGTVYNLAINSIGGVTIPAGDKQMIGGAIAVWNDMTDYLDNGVSEYDVYDRIKAPIPLMAAKLWGKGSMDLAQATATKDILGSAPGTNFDYKVDSKGEEIAHFLMDSLTDSTANKRDLKAGENAEIKKVDNKNALSLKGGKSYVESELTTIGLGNDLRVKVKRTSDSTDEQILFESDYGSIKAVQKDTGKVGFTRENFDYSFDYTLPVNEWVELEIKNQRNVAQLYVNGELVDTLGDGEKVEGRPLLATTMIPFARIGSKSNSFIGYVDDVRLGVSKEYNSTMKLDYAIWNAKEILKDKENAELTALVEDAEQVLGKFAPDANEVQTLVEQINNIIDTLDYEKADYSRVDAYRNLIADDLSMFTDASVNVLTSVLESIREDLPISLQDVVDGYEKLLADALQGLELKAKGNINYVDNSRLKATASSYQGGSGPELAIDDNEGTMWHTNWNVTTMPHWIDLKIDTPEAINGLTYLPRQTGGTNGMATKYEVQVSNDGINYTKVKEGTLSTSTRDAVVLEFDEVTTQHVRLVYLQAVNNNGTATELKLHLANTVADTDGLSTLIEQAEAIENIGYTSESWDALQDKIAEAKTLVEETNPDANNVEIMKGQLMSKMTSLVLNERGDNKELQALIEQAEAIIDNDKEDTMTSSSWNTFMNAYETAVNLDENASAIEVKVAKLALEEAIKNLEPRASETAVDALETLIDTCKAMEDDFLEADFAGMKTLIEASETLLAKGREDLSSSEVSKAIEDLLDAKKALEANKAETNSLLDTLEIHVEIAQDILDGDTSSYRPGKVKELEKAVAEGKALVEANSKDKAAIIAATDKIADAMSQLWDIVDKSELTSLIIIAEKYAEADYSAESWVKLETALAAAKTIVANDDATEAQVAKAYKDLFDAINGLERKINTEALEREIAAVEKILANKAKYVASSIKGLPTALESAKNVLANGKTQAEIDAATKALTKEKLKARLKADTSALSKMVTKANNLEVKGYTADSVKALNAAIKEAQAVIKNEEVSEAEVKAAEMKLQKAMKNLKKVNSPSKAPSSKDGGRKASTSAKGVASGDTTDINSLVGLMALAGLAMYGTFRKRLKHTK